MPQNQDKPSAIRVYTVCDESRYLIVRNVPALGCGDELEKLFGSYGEIEECKPMDAEDCEPFTDVYWIKFAQDLVELVGFSGSYSRDSRFAKRKLDEYLFIGNHLKVSYAPQFESLSDTMEKLEGRRKEVFSRINLGQRGSKNQVCNNSLNLESSSQHLSAHPLQKQKSSRDTTAGGWIPHDGGVLINQVSSNSEYFPVPSMNETVKLVREKLDKIQSSSQNTETAQASKRARVDNRRRI